MKVFYRISDNSFPNKQKPKYIENKRCFNNFVEKFGYDNLYVIADRADERTLKWLEQKSKSKGFELRRTNFGNGAQSFNLVLTKALEGAINLEEVVYFVEDDYLHRSKAKEVLQEAFDYQLGDYVTLYDHPDKYRNPDQTTIFVTDTCHWKTVDSTTMTFAARIATLQEDEQILREWTAGEYPHDYKMFLSLYNKGRTIVSSLPGYATHGETAHLAPTIDWKNVK